MEKVVWGVYGLFCLSVLILPMGLRSQYYDYYDIFLIVAASYVITKLVKAISAKEPGAIVCTAGMLILLAGGVYDIMITMKILYPPYIVAYCLIAFILAQSFILAKLFSRAYRQAEHLNKNLQSEVAKQTKEISSQKETIEAQLDKIKEDLDVARDVMQVMLPKNSVKDDHLGLQFLFVPADELAGDLYGQERLDGKLLLWLCDVTGHGVASSMVAGVIRESIAAARKEYIFCDNPDPSKVLEIASDRVNRSVQGKFFATMNLAIYDYKKRMLTVSSAAHMLPLHYNQSRDKPKPIRVVNGPLIGREKKKNTRGYSNIEYPLNSGDLVFFYTDGLIEAANPKDPNTLYGKRRLIKLIQKHYDNQNLNKILYDDMIKFQDTEILDDDVTMALLRIN